MVATTEHVLNSLAIPAGARVDQRVPKKLLVEQGAPTASDKRQINDSIDSLHWVAALKPTTIGVPVYRDEAREYLEITVLFATLRGDMNQGARVDRLMELIHRAIPYPVLLLVNAGAAQYLSMAHKRWAQNEIGKVVLEGGIVSVSLSADTQDPKVFCDFVENLSLNKQPRQTLFDLYQGWLNCIYALLAANLTGKFIGATSKKQAHARRQALYECEEIERELTRLHALTLREKQAARRVELNLTLKKLRARLAAARQAL